MTTRYSPYEVLLTTTNTYSNPYLDVWVYAIFNGLNKIIKLDGFWDGSSNWKIRITPTEVGTWNYITTSNDSQLNGKTGSFNVTESQSKGFIKVNPNYPYSFMYDDGTPYLLVGDNVWTMFNSNGYPFDTISPDGANFKSYVDKRVTQGFNWMHGQLGYWTGPNEGGDSLNLAGDVNPSYFQWIDKRVAYATGKGVVIGMTFDLYPYNRGGFSSLQRYSKYIVARYSAYNVVWLIAPEYEDDGSVVDVTGWRQIGQLVSAADPYNHPTSIHTTGTSGDDFGSDAWMTFVGQQHRGTPQSQNSYILADYIYNKPVVNLEPDYEGFQTANDLRGDFWAITVAGGFAVYGHKETFVAPEIPFNSAAMDSPGVQYLIYLYNFINKLPWWQMSAKNSLATSGFTLAKLGEEYVIYLPSGGSTTVNLSATSGNLSVEWYNPRTGTYQGQTTVQGGASRTFTAPDTNDWILYIYSCLLLQCNFTIT